MENKNGEAEIQNKAGPIRMSNSNSKEESVCKKINKKPVCLLFINFISLPVPLFSFFSLFPCSSFFSLFSE